MRKGFTLIELLVVIVIIAVLASLATVGLNSVRAKNRDAKRVADIRQLQTALETYINDNGSYPSAITAGNTLVGPNGQTYMAKVPAGPNSADGSCVSDTYAYVSISPYSAYSIYYCLGGAVQNAGPADCIAKPGQICSTVLAIGDSYQGGIIAYLDGTGHGFVAATSDTSNIRWSNGSAVDTEAHATAIGTGLANTNTIITVQGAVATSYAAGLARAYAGGGYSDWYLPSKDELAQLYANRVAVGIISYTENYYWSSSEYNTTDAWYQRFDGGSVNYTTKSSTDTLHLRAIRSF